MLSLLHVLIAVAAASPASVNRAVTLSPTRHVRSSNHYIEELIADGKARSYTFRTLVQHLEQTDVIVYVERSAALPIDVEGRMLIIGSGQTNRFLRVELAMKSTSDDLIALIGHELQHATEVANAPEVRDPKTLAHLYERIGHRGFQEDQFDTWAALDVGTAVRRELNA